MWNVILLNAFTKLKTKISLLGNADLFKLHDVYLFRGRKTDV